MCSTVSMSDHSKRETVQLYWGQREVVLEVLSRIWRSLAAAATRKRHLRRKDEGERKGGSEHKKKHCSYRRAPEQSKNL